MADADALKSSGNTAFAAGRYAEAEALYTRVRSPGLARPPPPRPTPSNGALTRRR
jgi:hypothetical protein